MDDKLKPELENLLLEYLGELKCKKESENDWIEKDKVSRKINAIDVLLGFSPKETTFFDFVKQVIR